jgi:hypothetical protein
VGDDVDRTRVNGRTQTGDVIELGFDTITCCIRTLAMAAPIENAGGESGFEKRQYGQPPPPIRGAAMHEDDVWTGATATVRKARAVVGSMACQILSFSGKRPSHIRPTPFWQHLLGAHD